MNSFTTITFSNIPEFLGQWWTYSSLFVGIVQYTFIAIIPRSTLSQSLLYPLCFHLSAK